MGAAAFNSSTKIVHQNRGSISLENHVDVKELIWNDEEPEKQIINHPTFPFTLWLEWEHTSPWDDPLNDFANVDVDTLDGRSFSMNVWTFQYADTTAKNKDDFYNPNGMYFTPPDLFVKELTRSCLEFTVGHLLTESEGHLDACLNESVFGLRLLPPWKKLEYDNGKEEAMIDVVEKEFKEFMDFDDVFVEGFQQDTGEVAIEYYPYHDVRQVVYVVSICAETGKIVADKNGQLQYQKYGNLKEFWMERLGQEIKQYKAQPGVSKANVQKD